MKKSERIVLEQFYHGALKDYLEFSNQGRRPLVLYQATLHDAVCFGLAFTLLKRKDGSLRKQGEVEKWYTQRALVLSETSGGVEELIGEEHNAINIFWTSDVDSKDNSSKRGDEGAYKIDLEYVYQSDSYSKPQGLD